MRRHQELVNIANFTIDVVLILVAYGLATWLRNGYLGGAPTSFFSLFDRQYVAVACVYAVHRPCLCVLPLIRLIPVPEFLP